MVEVYKCPSCTGAVVFDAKRKTLACRWCGNEYAPGELPPKQMLSQLNEYRCTECGAEVVADGFQASVQCPYCGNNEVLASLYRGEFEPAGIISFSVNKQDAVSSYEGYIAEKKYLPDDYAAKSKIIGMQGVYVPFWLLEGECRFKRVFYAKRNDPESSDRQWFEISGRFQFADVPADASAHMPDSLMDSIEPFDYGAIEPFNTRCMPGYLAERHSIGEEDGCRRAKKRAKGSATDFSRAKVTGAWDKVRLLSDECDESVEISECRLVMLPVWVLTIEYEGARFLAGVNAQTGKVASNLPVDLAKKTEAISKGAAKGAIIALLCCLPILILAFYGISRLRTSGAETAFVLGLVALIALPLIFKMAAKEMRTGANDVEKDMHTDQESESMEAFLAADPELEVQQYGTLHRVAIGRR